MVIKLSHICVCICTYKRQKLLERLLKKLQNQKTDKLFSYSIIVIDNDHKQSAKNIVKDFKEKSKIVIEYYIEPEQNIALARNKALQNAIGNFVAFVDDDEFPVNDWLYNLYKTYNEFKSDCVFGPVKPHFDKEPPGWIIKGKLCERPAYETGTILHWQNRGTGNVLISKDVLDDRENVFNPKFGTQGEDVDFFKRLIEKGYTFVWCDEAAVHETVPPDRWKLSYFLNRALHNGRNSILRRNKNQHYCQKVTLILKTIIAFFIYTLVLPFLLLIGRHVFVKYLIKNFNHIGRIFTLLGINVARNKNH